MLQLTPLEIAQLQVRADVPSFSLRGALDDVRVKTCRFVVEKEVIAEQQAEIADLRKTLVIANALIRNYESLTARQAQEICRLAVLLGEDAQ